ncbi:MAG: hypothetical protein F4Y80_14380, partial [Caldilineaceae bacterium SB0665_bin_21]|nr:hypothetical protein [Caldilineaceae bacterium SB0665_bin_21]
MRSNVGDRRARAAPATALSRRRGWSFGIRSPGPQWPVSYVGRWVDRAGRGPPDWMTPVPAEGVSEQSAVAVMIVATLASPASRQLGVPRSWITGGALPATHYLTRFCRRGLGRFVAVGRNLMKLFHLLVTVLTLSVVLLAACAPPEAAVPPEEAEEPAAEMAAPESEYSQSPYLDARVAAGELPPVDERLPTNPLVVTAGVISEVDDLPDLEIGEYGGVMRFAHPSPDVHADIAIMLIENVLAAPGIGITGIYGNVVESYEVNDDNTVFSFNLREGLRWSDGEPVTTADVRFAHEDVLLHETYSTGLPNKFRSAGSPDGEPMNLEILDDYTFRITFAEQYGGFLRELSIKGWQTYSDLFKPAHHLKAIHVDYAEADDIQAMADEKGLDTPQALFAAVDCGRRVQVQQRCAEFPGLYPWINVTEEKGFMKYVRNPYYFKVDAAGNQLPY